MGVTVTDVDICDLTFTKRFFMYSCAQLQKSDLGRHVAAFWFHMSSETMVPARRHIPLPPPQTHISLPPPPSITVSSPLTCVSV